MPNDDKKPAVTFETEGEFLAAVEKKTTKAVKQAQEKLRQELFAELGLDDGDEIASVKEKLTASKAAKSESDKLSAEIKKLTKERDELSKSHAELLSFKQGTMKRDAIMAHASKTRDPDVLVQLVSSKLTPGEDGSFDPKQVEEIVTKTLADKAYLRSAEFKEGAGTKSTPAKTPGGSTQPANGQNAPQLTPAQVIAQTAQAIFEGRADGTPQ